MMHWYSQSSWLVFVDFLLDLSTSMIQKNIKKTLGSAYKEALISTRIQLYILFGKGRLKKKKRQEAPEVN